MFLATSYCLRSSKLQPESTTLPDPSSQGATKLLQTLSTAPGKQVTQEIPGSTLERENVLLSELEESSKEREAMTAQEGTRRQEAVHRYSKNPSQQVSSLGHIDPHPHQRIAYWQTEGVDEPTD